MNIKASDIKTLRETTGAGMMDCKRALEDTNGDIDKATKLLKEKGLAAVAKRADRATAEGRIYIQRKGNKIAVVELVCETDFVSKNDEFTALGQKLVDLTLEKGYTKVEPEHSDMLTVFATKVRENMSVRHVSLIDVPENAVAGTYVHSDFKTGAVCIVKGSTDPKVQEFANDCCLHLAAFTPAYITQKDVPQSYMDEQMEIFTKQLDQDDFVDQMFVKDDKVSVAAKLAEVSKEVGAPLEFGEVHLYVLGR